MIKISTVAGLSTRTLADPPPAPPLLPHRSPSSSQVLSRPEPPLLPHRSPSRVALPRVGALQAGAPTPAPVIQADPLHCLLHHPNSLHLRPRRSRQASGHPHLPCFQSSSSGVQRGSICTWVDFLLHRFTLVPVRRSPAVVHADNLGKFGRWSFAG